MARVWKAGGQELWDDQIPFPAGSDEYYKYVTAWRARALGVALPPPSAYGDQWHRVGKDDQNNARLNYWMDQFEQTKALDRRGQTADRYIHQDGKDYYDTNQNGVVDPGEGYGKYGGAGNRNPAAAADNRWSDVDGNDVRTAQQKFYDRDLKNFQQVADGEGKYSWYADWTYRDANGSPQQKRINLTFLGNRVGSEGNGQYDRPVGADFAGDEYWNYNDAPDKAFFEDALRTRENKSLAARSGFGGYR